MSLRAKLNSPVGFIVGFIAILLVVFVVDKMSDFPGGNVRHVRLGENKLVLEPGSYVLWWQVKMRTGSTGSEDFDFQLTSEDGRSIPVREPLFGAGLQGEAYDLTIWKLAKFTIRGDGGSFVLKARLLSDVPKGELLLISDCPESSFLDAFCTK